MNRGQRLTKGRRPGKAAPKVTVSRIPEAFVLPPLPKARGNLHARRRTARLVAVQALYLLEQSDFTLDDAIAHAVRWPSLQSIEGQELVTPEPELCGRIVRDATLRRADVEGLVSAALPKEWSLSRLYLLLRTVLRAGAGELLCDPATPAAIVINDYMDVAKAFFDPPECKMVNAVLDTIAKRLRPTAVEQAAVTL